MHWNRHVGPILASLAVLATPLAAQNGSIHGQVVDSVTQQALAGATVQLVFRSAGLTVQPGRQVVTDAEGRFTLTDVAAGAATVKVTLIGYGPQQQEVNVAAGGTADARFALSPQAAILEPVVVTGYGSQRREAITGSVATVSADVANVGVKTNADQLLQGRAAGVNILQNNGEPGAGAQVLIRGGSSLSATNEPLYVIDGVPVNNVATEPDATGIGGSPALARNPLNDINPGDIANITVLKDASATAIYGSRASNGVVLIETKKGNASSGPTFEYNGYVSTSSPARKLDVLNGAEYRAFVTTQVSNWRTDSTAFCGRHPSCTTDTTVHYSDSAAAFSGLVPSHLTTLGSANTDWASAITRSSVTHNHNLSFSGGTEATRYRASLNYANEQGVTLSTGLERIQGRLSATHSDLNNRLRMELNVTTSRVNNTYLTYENNGGFEGGVFENVATFNPTLPVTVTDSTGTRYFEVGGTSIRNPVALANQIQDVGQTNRTLGNGTVSFDLTAGLTAKVTVGLDHSSGQRQEYFPLANPVGQALGGGFARQATLNNQTQTIQTVLNYQRPFGNNNTVDVVGGYEYSKFNTSSITATGTGFFTDAFSFNNLNAATTRQDYSDATEARLASFFGRANVGLNDLIYLTGVLRYDGSSRFAVGHKWAAFPGISGSYHLSKASFAQSLPFSDLKIRLGWGLQGNPSVDPYTSLITLAGNTGAAYPWGDVAHGGVLATSNGNPDLKWEQTSQIDGAVDFALMNNRISGSLEYYHKNTKDLLLTVAVAQPALNDTQLKNVGKLSGHGLEFTLDALAISRPSLTWRAGLVLAAERTKVVDLGGGSINTGFISGQGQSNAYSQRLIEGQPVGTFYGPLFVGVDANGKQVYACTAATVGCVNGRTTLGQGTAEADYRILGNANPDFTLGFHSEINWNHFDISFLIRAAVGQDVFNNTALVYGTKSDALQDKNFLRDALNDPTGIHEPAIFSSKWVENASFVRLQNITVGYDLHLPVLTRSARSARVYVSADNLILLTGYSGLDPEVYTSNGLATRGLDYLTYPRPRTITGGLRLLF